MQKQSFILANQDKFNPSDMMYVREQLDKLTEKQIELLPTVGENFKNPMVALILSIFLGHLGIDRFYVGSIGLGVLKLFTLGAFGIWTIIDWFQIRNMAKKANMKKFMENINTLKAMAK